MANLKGVIVVVGTVVAAVGVYYGLEKVMPKKEAAPIVNKTASADEVFGKAIDESAPPPKVEAPPPNAAPARAEAGRNSRCVAASSIATERSARERDGKDRRDFSAAGASERRARCD